MTVVVGIVGEDGSVFMGADSLGSSGTYKVSRSDPKVFVKGRFIICGSGSFRMLNLLNYKFDPPVQTASQDDLHYINVTVVDYVRKLFSENALSDDRASSFSGSSFMLGYNGAIYGIQSDFQCARNMDNYMSLGAGMFEANGSLATTAAMNIGPADRIQLAIEAAIKFNGSCGLPINIIELQAERPKAAAKQPSKKTTTKRSVKTVVKAASKPATKTVAKPAAKSVAKKNGK